MDRSAMDRDEMVRRVEDHYRSFWAGTVDDFDTQLAPDFVDASSPPGTAPGPESVKAPATANSAAFPDMKVSFDDTVVEGDKVVVRARWQGTNTGPVFGRPATGRRVDFSGIVIWRFDRSGRIDRRWAQVDFGALMQQLEAPADA
jgi:predicted ester cyclase